MVVGVDDVAEEREERSGMQRRNGDAAYGKAGFGGLGGLHPWQLKVELLWFLRKQEK